MLSFAGCATNPAIAVKKAGLKTVGVEPRIDSKQGMRYGVDLQGGLANMLASAIVDSAGKKGIARMSTVMETNHIVVSDLVHESVIKRLRENPDLKLTEADADGTFVVRILQFGFDYPGLESSRKFPFVLLQAELWDRKGKRLWINQNTTAQLTSKGIGATWDQYEADPEKLRADWSRQVDNVVTNLFPDK